MIDEYEIKYYENNKSEPIKIESYSATCHSWNKHFLYLRAKERANKNGYILKVYNMTTSDFVTRYEPE